MNGDRRNRERRLAGVGLVLLACMAPAAVAARPGCDAIVYWDANFGGESEELREDVPFVGPHWNDQISSIKVLAGTWEFYWDAGYKGEVLRYEPGAYAFVGAHWNDQISSMRCIAGSGGGATGYTSEGRAYDFYEDGWNGPGFYVVGSEHLRGRGFAGREGTHGWHRREHGNGHESHAGGEHRSEDHPHGGGGHGQAHGGNDPRGEGGSGHPHSGGGDDPHGGGDHPHGGGGHPHGGGGHPHGGGGGGGHAHGGGKHHR